MRRLRNLAELVTVLVAVLAATGAAAELYKWVDERGVVNYSDQPPADPKTASKLTTVEDRVSVYTPDKALMQALEAERRGAPGKGDARFEAERPARPFVALLGARTPQLPSDPCLDASRIECGAFFGSYYPAWSGVRHVAISRKSRIVPQITLTPGTIAGNVTGMSGYIPGNSAAAAALNPLPPAPHFSSPKAAGHPKRGAHAWRLLDTPR